MIWKSAFAAFILSAAMTATLSAQVQTSTESPRDQLQQYVAQLQANPSNDALRMKIIQLALTLDPKPAVPQDAAVDAAKGKTIFASATSLDDMKAAAAAFAQASQLAPWVPDYYYNEGLALEEAKQYDDAIHALNFYLLAAPNASDISEVRGKMEGIKYEKDSAAKQAEQQVQAAQKGEQQFLLGLAGAWTRAGATHFISQVDGTGSFKLARQEGFPEEYQGTVSGHEIEGTYAHTLDFHGQICGLGVVQLKGTFSGTVSDDGQTISIRKSMPPQRGLVDVSSCLPSGETDSNETFQKQ